MGMTTEQIIKGLLEAEMICDSVFAYDRRIYFKEAIKQLKQKKKLQAKCKAQLKESSVYAKWVKSSPSPYEPYRCSNCNSAGITLFDYCPFCGAMMGVEDGRSNNSKD